MLVVGRKGLFAGRMEGPKGLVFGVNMGVLGTIGGHDPKWTLGNTLAMLKGFVWAGLRKTLFTFKVFMALLVSMGTLL